MRNPLKDLKIAKKGLILMILAVLLINPAFAAEYEMECAGSEIKDMSIEAGRIPSTCSVDVLDEGIGLDYAILGDNLGISEREGKYVFTIEEKEEKSLILQFSDGDTAEYAYFPPEGSLLDGGISNIEGNYTYLLLGVAFLIITFAIIWLFKQFIANMISGLIALFVLNFIFNVGIPINGLTILVSIMGGLGGVGALLIAAVFGWL